jgi:diguanylate cyclase (GGDEF)-like protein
MHTHKPVLFRWCLSHFSGGENIQEQFMTLMRMSANVSNLCNRLITIRHCGYLATGPVEKKTMHQEVSKPGQWIVRMNYRNRTILFIVLFATLGAHMASKDYSLGAWGFLGLQFLVYPHLLNWRATRAIDSGRAELNNMVLDTVAFGAWAAVLDFPLWISFILVVGATVNLAVFRGPKGVILAAAAMIVGATLVVAVTGLHVAPETNPVVTAMSIACVLMFLMVVESGAYYRALKLHETRERLRVGEQALQSANNALKQQLEEIHALQSKLSEQAIRDPLTGLYNRRYLDSTMEREVARCKREGHPLSLMLIDIDHFKRINDTYGHQAGDEVLKKLASMLLGRVTDIACRYGGEEFLVLLPNMPHSTALEKAEQHRKAFEEAAISFGEFTISATLSAGIATYPGHGTSPNELIGHADQALYRAKAAGRNRVVICDWIEATTQVAVLSTSSPIHLQPCVV